MLEIINYGEGEYDFPCLLVLGCFDGLHIGLGAGALQRRIRRFDGKEQYSTAGRRVYRAADAFYAGARGGKA